LIISHKYQFIFIKTRKTAGTSCEVYLSQHCGPDDLLTPIAPEVPAHVPRNHYGYYNHISGSEIRKRIGNSIWDNYFRFCVERNPWDKTISQYHFTNQYMSLGNLSFEEFLAIGDFWVDHYAYTEPNDPNKLIVNRVLRYENLNEELADVFALLGIPFSGSLGVHAKSEYRIDRRPYREVYSADQARMVESAFSQEIKLFGYTY
jgi:hypothetical protein